MMKTATTVLFFLLFSCGAVSTYAHPPNAQAGAVRVLYDLPYTSALEKTPGNTGRLDVYAPDRDGQFPVIIWIHGGGWTKGDKSFVQHKPRVFTSKGFVFVSINYRLVPNVKVTDQATDVARATRFVPRRTRPTGHMTRSPGPVTSWPG